jgi:adenine-specific DNA-methyltransferase
MTEEPEKFDLRSENIVSDKQAALRAAFPEVITEGGKIDFERLKLALGEAIDVGKERYGMNWPGKADCFKAIQQSSLATLLPAKDESVNWDTTANLIIEGDNLEVLKLLQKSYLGQVKMIYIDPPYNTGNDFIYPDDYTESLDTYLRYTGQIDSEGRKYSTNTEAEGRFHSKWLNMIYPRLYIARNLLREDGVIFISIDDAEVANLRKLCEDVFGEENFLANFVRRRRMATGMRDNPISPDHEYILSYAKNLSAIRLFGFARREDDFPFQDERGRYRSTDLTVGMTKEMRPNQFYPITNPKTKADYLPPDERVWRFEPTTMQRQIDDGNIIWPDDNPTGRMTRPRFKTRFDSGDNADKTNPVSTWVNSKSDASESGEDDNVVFLTAGLNQEATKELRDLLGEQVLDYPKPVSLVKGLCAIGSRADDIILDFFAGSGTTAQAVYEINKQDGGNRKFMLVQLPEPTQRKDFRTISDITKERVRRVIKKLNAQDAGKLNLENGGKKPDRGFRVFKLQNSNFKTWNADVPKEPAALAQQLEMHVHHIVEGRTQDDLLFEILLKSGFPLTTPIERLTLTDQTIFSIAEGAMLICLEKKLTPELIKAMADRNPERVVCLDEGFAGNDQLKTNAVQTMKAKGVVKFQTV